MAEREAGNSGMKRHGLLTGVILIVSSRHGTCLCVGALVGRALTLNYQDVNVHPGNGSKQAVDLYRLLFSNFPKN